MCSQYWTLLNVPFTCPKCGSDVEDDLQTHFMGEPGSCINDYALNEPVRELGDISATLGKGKVDDFIGACSNCGSYFDFGAKIKDGKVIEVWVENA